MCIVALKSNTYAQKVHKLLNNNNIDVKITRIEPQMTKKGCSYGVSFSCEKIFIVQALLNQNNIKYSEILGI